MGRAVTNSYGAIPQQPNNQWNTGGTNTTFTTNTGFTNNNGGWGGNNTWPTGNGVSITTEPKYGSSDTSNVGTINSTNIIPTILTILEKAVDLYDTGIKPKIDVAREVDVLRKKIDNGTFNPRESRELKNIFGYMFGDVIAEMAYSPETGSDYDDIMGFIFKNFPKGSGGLGKVSKYVTGDNDGSDNSVINNLLKIIKTFERRNNLTPVNTKHKFQKILEKIKTSGTQGFDVPDSILEDLFNEYRNR